MPKRENATLFIVGLGCLLAFPAVGAGESLVAAQERRVLHRRSLRRLVTPPPPLDVSQPSAPQPAPSLPPAPPAATTPPSPPEEPSRPARAVELRFWYNRTALQAGLSSQRRVPAAAPKHRKVKPQAGDLVLQGEDRNGTVLWQRPLSDPTILFSDTFNPSTRQLTPGGLLRVDTVPLWVYVPSDPALARVRLFAPIEVDESGAQKPWRSLGSWSIEP